MIPQSTIEAIKKVSIVNYLDTLGVRPLKYAGAELVYFSPKQTESTPSFFVNPLKNVFHDYTTNERGDIIRLVQYLTGCTFVKSIEILQKFEPADTIQPFLFSGHTLNRSERASKMIVTKVLPLKHGALFNYAYQRGISSQLAEKYLVEVHYKLKHRRTYALGFANDKGGLEIRNPYYKSCTAPKWITTFNAPYPTNTVDVFEGFFDFLSSLAFFGLIVPRNTTIVLNSLSNLKHSLDTLKEHQQVRIFFDNDMAGQKAKADIEAMGFRVIDGSKYYQGYKDFNEFISLKNG